MYAETLLLVVVKFTPVAVESMIRGELVVKPGLRETGTPSLLSNTRTCPSVARKVLPPACTPREIQMITRERHRRWEQAIDRQIKAIIVRKLTPLP